MTADGVLRPVDVARAAGVSTQHVRDLDAAGVLPPGQRTPSGYRRYRSQHLQALLTYQALTAGYGSASARAVLTAVHAGELARALEHLDRCRAARHRERELLQDARRALLDITGEDVTDARPGDSMSVGELADALGLRTSTLRSWDAAGVVSPGRTTGAGYRSYTPRDVRDVRLTQQLRLGQHGLDPIRRALRELTATADPAPLLRLLQQRETALHARSLAGLRGDARLANYLDDHDLAGAPPAGPVAPPARLADPSTQGAALRARALSAGSSRR